MHDLITGIARIYIIYIYLESYMSRVLDIPKYRANKDKDKINQPVD